MPIPLVPRCAAVVNVQGVCIANVHLSGGRFDDAKAAYLLGLKTRQLETVLQRSPDIVVGDFNGEPVVGRVANAYAKTLDKLVSEAEFKSFYTDGHALLRKQGYAPVLPGKGQSEAPVTSMFGTTPDWIYYNTASIKTAEVEDPLQMVDFLGAGLSDHNALVATFEVFVGLKRNPVSAS